MSFKVTKTEPRGSAKAKKIASSISYVDATGSVTYTDAAGTVSHVDLSSTVEYTSVASAVSSRYISPSAITLGYYLLKHEAFDAFTAADVFVANFSKNLFDEIAVAGDKTIFYNMKAPSDTAAVSTILDLGLQKRIAPDFAQFSDNISYQVDFKRTFIEQGEYGDVIVFATTKLIADTAQTDDNIAFSTATTKEDTLNASELISNGLGKVFTNSFGVADEATLNQNKNISDDSSFVDDIRFDLGLALSDFVNVTDDFLGEANIDDDQTMHFGKTLLINGSASDTLARAVQYNRVFGDNLSVNEALSLGTNKTLSEQITTNDTLERTVQFDRNFSDLSIVTTTIAIDTGRVLQDNGTVVESAVKSPNKVSNDSASITDSGALFWQDYVEDPSYFGEDYVGNRQLF